MSWCLSYCSTERCREGGVAVPHSWQLPVPLLDSKVPRCGEAQVATRYCTWPPSSRPAPQGALGCGLGSLDVAARRVSFRPLTGKEEAQQGTWSVPTGTEGWRATCRASSAGAPAAAPTPPRTKSIGADPGRGMEGTRSTKPPPSTSTPTPTLPRLPKCSSRVSDGASQ